MLTDSRAESDWLAASLGAAERRPRRRPRLRWPVRAWLQHPVSPTCFGRAGATGDAILRGLAASLASSEQHEGRW
jgi:hypothetical protein